ncbi:uncharacterized protein LOC129598903 [Paramacrobiotus metropolitanus]|uniref:uncharacterized protein LOC129598903 n=1 Tax=Paramacrobiotus metropolitanus TaxID=2943436 RepID=UPI0024460CFA|nr:uncharacterized protein LOC129598903 [Paramacrobiotus metropolitanus]XP_055352966.1 uncharacterized protein LOC129598903 [Paramacrobiotus metropolitanus]XP_055352967.1 uncharacterized protein LOC129598903 [Paramacrobiotus metropolitanus]
MFLFYLRQLVECGQALNEWEVRSAVISVPATMAIVQRRAIKLAAAMAGMETARILDDPVAAVLPYITSFPCRKQHVLTLELNLQYLAVSILKVVKSKPGSTIAKLCSSNYSTRLAEEIIDERILKHVRAMLKEVYSVSLVANVMLALGLACTKINGNDRQIIKIPPYVLGGKSFSVAITPSMLAVLCHGLFHSIIVPVEDVLARASLTASDVADVIIMGCGRFVPQITEVLIGLFPAIQVHATVDPRIVVAEGAALLASNVLNGSDKTIDIREWLGCQLIAHVPSETSNMVIPKRSRLPVETEVVCTTSIDNQRFIDIEIKWISTEHDRIKLQCQYNQMAKGHCRRCFGVWMSMELGYGYPI